MAAIKIFIASSSELVQDRKDFRAFLSIENDRGHKKGVYLELLQWEHFLDAVSETRLQDEYNKKVKSADIVICLFYTRAGKYTQEEFDTALTQFKETGSPLIYTYFKDGAPEPDATDQVAINLKNFKERLSKLGHFYTSYSNIDNLKLKFRQQLDRLVDKGYINLQEEIKAETLGAITHYLKIKNSVIDSTITAGGDVHIGDNIIQSTKVEGSNNIIIQGSSESSITVNVNGQIQEVEKKLDALQALMEKLDANSIQTADKTYNIATITDANFGFMVDQAGRKKSLPTELAENLIGEGDGWITSLRQELERKQKVSVGDTPLNIIQNYGWLVETFLQKMLTPTGREKNLRRLSFLAEAWQGSLRYLCYIQVAQLLQKETSPKLKILSNFLQMQGTDYLHFDYSSLLLTTTEAIGKNGFIPEINILAKELNNTDSALYSTVLFLDDQRDNLIAGKIKEDDQLDAVLDEYLTGLVYWLRKVSFLAKYRMVSIKEINLDYRLGTAKNFVHLYGELHGFYSESGVAKKDYDTKWVEDAFTYSKSILLFKGQNVSSGLDNIQEEDAYLSLSPLIIDQSVYVDKATQTPEVFYFSGYEKAKRCYRFSQYKNELNIGKNAKSASNKLLEVKTQNNNQPKLDELFEQLEDIFEPLKS